VTETTTPPEETPAEIPPTGGSTNGEPTPEGANRTETPVTPPPSLGARVRRTLLAADAWIDTAVYRAGTGLVEWYRRYSLMLRVFRVRGLKRLLLDLIGDGVTFGALGSILMLTLALPAMDVTRTDWRKNVDYSVLMLDRYGTEIGRRGIILNDSDRKSTRLNSSHNPASRMPSSA
jgi:penicillin-binding protein 1A